MSGKAAQWRLGSAALLLGLAVGCGSSSAKFVPGTPSLSATAAPTAGASASGGGTTTACTDLQNQIHALTAAVTASDKSTQEKVDAAKQAASQIKTDGQTASSALSEKFSALSDQVSSLGSAISNGASISAIAKQVSAIVSSTASIFTACIGQ
jgi:hypothetical protein